MNNPVCIITEKPSVAMDIAKVLNVTHKSEGYLYNDQYKITWAYGHLVALADPQTYGFTSYAREELPMLPKPFKLVVRQVKKKDGKGYEEDDFARKQLDVIKQCFDSSERIIVATDAGREGELIFRYIYYYLGCSKPFDRLWLSSMTDQAIRDAFTKLKEGQLYDNLYLAGKARSEADWLVGMNASRALTIASNGSGGLSLGRVQTPTLCMICDRYLSNKNFVKSPFWKVNAQVKSGETTFPVSSPEPITNKGLADSKLYAVSNLTSLTVTKAERKSTSSQPPLLYDLTTLQKEANKQELIPLLDAIAKGDDRKAVVALSKYVSDTEQKAANEIVDKIKKQYGYKELPLQSEAPRIVVPSSPVQEQAQAILDARGGDVKSTQKQEEESQVNKSSLKI